jgi:hypothetical protein
MINGATEIHMRCMLSINLRPRPDVTGRFQAIRYALAAAWLLARQNRSDLGEGVAPILSLTPGGVGHPTIPSERQVAK